MKLILTALLALTLFGQSTPAPKRDGVPALIEADRLLIREAQLVMAQAHINRLQAEAQVRQAEDNLNRLLQSLKSQYQCIDCELNNADFTWVRTPALSEPKPATTPAPEQAGGNTSQKEQ